MKDTDWVVAQGRQESWAPACFWSRGILPLGLHSFPEPQDEVVVSYAAASLCQSLEAQQGLPSGAVVYTDGSGGEHSALPRIRRCAWAVVYPSWQGGTVSIEQGWSAPLEGPLQTIGRAELRALIHAVSLASGELEVHSDSKYVVDGFAARRWEACGGRGGKNADLWHWLGRVMAGAEGPIRVIKVKAHLKPSDVASGRVALSHYGGNALADLLAGEAARRAQIPLEQVRPYLSCVELCRAVLVRLVRCNLCAVLKAPELPEVRVFRAPRQCPIEVALREAGHQMAWAGLKGVCSRCHQVVGRQQAKAWAQLGLCTPPPAHSQAPFGL